MKTPWGSSQSVETVAPGIQFVSTAGHGGFKLSPALNRKVPNYMRSEDGWYEEDTEWAIVATVFPEAFDEKVWEDAERILRNYYPDIYETFYFGKKIPEGQSMKKDEAAFLRKHEDDWIVIAAFGDLWKAGFPRGYAGVVATKGGRRGGGVQEKWFLVPVEEYDAREGFGFVVDPSRHQEIESLQ